MPELNSFQKTIKQSMLNFPILYKEKWQVCAHMFCSGGAGYEWQEDGTLVCYYKTEERTTMKLDKESTYDRMMKDMPENYQLDPLHKAWIECNDEVDAALTLLREKYIDSIVQNPCRTFFMSRDTHLTTPHFYMENASFPGKTETPAFYWPKNIALDWAEGLLDFIGFWLETIDHCGKHLKDYERMRIALLENQNNLNLRVYGKTTQVLQEARATLAKRLIADILKEEK